MSTITLPPKILIGLIGSSIQASLSPAMHEQEAREQGLRLHYQIIDLAERGLDANALPGLVDAMRTIGFAGFNVTFPCKQAILPLLDELDDEARAMGAVNTVVNRGGRLSGHNTDGSGWRWGFQRALPNADCRHVVLLGAGGAGSAIAHQVMRMGAARFTIVDQDSARSHALTATLNTLYQTGAHVTANTDIAAALVDATGLIHATPTGMTRLPGMPVPAGLLRPNMWVSDVVYVPLDTELLRTARRLGCTTVDGGTMAVGQALGAFRHFTGRDADAARIERHFRAMVRGWAG